MITFTESGHVFRAYNLGHCFRDGIEISSAEFYKALHDSRIHAQTGGVV